MKKDDFVKNLNGWKDNTVKELNKRVKEINDADTYEAIMRKKVNMMVWLVKNLPINPKTCIFCNNFECSDCPYGKTHVCNKIHDGQDEFVSWIKKTYA